MPIKNRFAEMLPEITSWRRDLHEHPEIMYETHRTAAFVADKLREFGCDEVTTGIGRVGVVGVIKGKSDTGGRVVGLRADMDALPILEETGLDYASKTPGAMHACGHDGHTAMLLGTAKYLAETRNFDGTCVVIFQPAEEGGAGGLAMIKDGLLDRWNIQEVYAIHNKPGMPVGHFATRAGPIMASAGEFELTVKGQGGHAAQPHFAVDAVLVASQIVVAIQSIVARNVDPLKQAVISVCTIHGSSTAYNVISETVELKGTVRTLDPAVHDHVVDRLRSVVTNTAEAYGATAELNYRPGYPATVNTEENAVYATEVAEAVSGAVDGDVPPSMGGEDFSYMLQERPGAYIFLGIGEGAGWHHPKYNFNDEAIPAGCSWFAGMVETRMPAG